MLVAAAVEEGPRTTPPTSPTLGACYIVATSPTGEWAGKQLNIASYTAGGWRFAPPIEGMATYVRSLSLWAVFRSGGWDLGTLRGSNVTIGGQQVVAGRAAAIPGPASGSVVDTQARSAIGQILTMLREHGLIET